VRISEELRKDRQAVAAAFSKIARSIHNQQPQPIVRHEWSDK
jgi:hypothetical protein